MTGKAQDGRQFTLLDGSLDAPSAGQREPLRQRKRKAKALQTSQTPPPPHNAPRGDLFREYAERQWSSPDNKHPTPEDVRENAYRRLASSVATSTYRRKKQIRGPIEKLRRAMGSNRYWEFAEWLNRIRGIKGASVPVRYNSLLSLIEKRIEEVAIEYRYTCDDFDNVTFYINTKKQLETVRDLVRMARADTVELQPLLSEMASLYACLGSAKRLAASPAPPEPVRVSDDEGRAWLAAEAQRKAQEARDRRVAESRRWLRDLMEPDKRSDRDVRCCGHWISLASLAVMLGDDLRGFGRLKPLWSSLLAAAELAEDYRISQRDARRVLAEYRGERISDAGAAPQKDEVTAVLPSASGIGGRRAADPREERGSAVASAQGNNQVAEVAAAPVRRRPQARRR